MAMLGRQLPANKCQASLPADNNVQTDILDIGAEMSELGHNGVGCIPVGTKQVALGDTFPWVADIMSPSP